MAELILTMGLPFSGKTEWSRKWVDRDPDNRMRMCRSDFRRMAMNSAPKGRRASIEDAITDAMQAMAETAINRGVSVVVDDVNITATHRKQWEELAERIGAELWVEDFLFEPLEDILRRRRAAPGKDRIPEHKLIKMHKRYAHKED